MWDWDNDPMDCAECGWRGKGYQVKWRSGPTAFCPLCGKSNWIPYKYDKFDRLLESVPSLRLILNTNDLLLGFRIKHLEGG